MTALLDHVETGENGMWNYTICCRMDLNQQDYQNMLDVCVWDTPKTSPPLTSNTINIFYLLCALV